MESLLNKTKYMESMESNSNEKLIVVSAINFFEGGPLSILMDSIQELSSSRYQTFQIIFFIHKIELIRKIEYSPNITFVELPKSRKNYLFRLYYEYIYFQQFSKKVSVYLWLSLHDITPNVKANKRAVYCHNPTPFYQNKIKDLFLYPTLFFSSIFYKYLYKINIYKNDFVIVQPYWMKKAFKEMFDLQETKIIVASPILDKGAMTFPNYGNNIENTKLTFFYPCISRPFKNIEVIADACKILSQKNINNYQLILTINGSENNYSKKIYEKYKSIPEIKFLGQITRDSVLKQYENSDVLLFPSTLETWGLPITEYKPFDKPMFVSDLPYAKETVGVYDKVDFLNPKNPTEWAQKMHYLILKTPYKFMGNKAIKIPNPKANNWSSIFNILLQKN